MCSFSELRNITYTYIYRYTHIYIYRYTHNIISYYTNDIFHSNKVVMSQLLGLQVDESDYSWPPRRLAAVCEAYGTATVSSNVLTVPVGAWECGNVAPGCHDLDDLGMVAIIGFNMFNPRQKRTWVITINVNPGLINHGLWIGGVLLQ